MKEAVIDLQARSMRDNLKSHKRRDYQRKVFTMVNACLDKSMSAKLLVTGVNGTDAVAPAGGAGSLRSCSPCHN